VRINYWI